MQKWPEQQKPTWAHRAISKQRGCEVADGQKAEFERVCEMSGSSKAGFNVNS